MNYWRFTTANRTKKIYSFGATDFFANARQLLKMSTLVRINYLCQPIPGLLFKTVNFFQDGSVRYQQQFRQTDKYRFLYLRSAIGFHPNFRIG